MDLIEKIWNFTSVFHKGESIQPKEENLQPIEEKLDPKIEKFQPNQDKNQFTEENLHITDENWHSTEGILEPTKENLQLTEEILQSVEENLQPTEENLQPTDILCNICDVSLKHVESLNIHYLEHVNNKRCTVNIEKLNAIHLDKLIYNNAAKETFKNDFTTFDDSMEVTNTDIKTNNHNKTETSNNKTVFEETTEDAKDNYTIINSSDSNDLSIRLTIKKEPKVKRKKICHITADIKEESSKDSVNIFPCHVCQDLFNSTKSLTFHIETLHSDVEKLTCAMCQKKFPNFTNLMIHTRKHLGIRPFSCHHCTKSFCDAKYLNDHKSRCKKVLSPNPNAKDDLASKIIYTAKGSSPCNVCRQAFDNYGDLRRHVGLIHPEQVDNLTCSICQQKIARFDALMDHTRRHLNIRPYSCAKCGAAFHTKPNVNQHVKSCHKSAINKDSKNMMDVIESDNFLDILEAVPAPKEIVFIYVVIQCTCKLDVCTHVR